MWPLMCVGSSNPAGSREEGVGTGKETPAGQDGTMCSDIPWSWRQPGPGRNQWPHAGVLRTRVPVVPWGTLAKLFFLLSSLSCFYLPPPPPSMLLHPHLPLPWERGEWNRIYPCSTPLGLLDTPQRLCSRTGLMSNTSEAFLGLAPPRVEYPREKQRHSNSQERARGAGAGLHHPLLPHRVHQPLAQPGWDCFSPASPYDVSSDPKGIDKPDALTWAISIPECAGMHGGTAQTPEPEGS